MRCPVHIAVEMRFVARPLKDAPRLRRKGPTLNDVDASFDVRKRPGILRCAVPGCARCAVMSEAETPNAQKA